MNIYFECNMGASGDMLASALVDLFENKEQIISELNALSLPHTVIKYGEKSSCGINGTHLHVMIDGEEEGHHHHHSEHSHSHHGRGLSEIFDIIDSLSANEAVKQDAKNIYKIIAEAEAKVHNSTAGEVHFHELGMLDAIADVTMSAYLINRLKPERIITSYINAGNGTVKCAHGIMPVPAPATAEILKAVPYYKGDIQTELCTPTGAAILKYYTDEFSNTPILESTKKIGIGTGSKELSQANILRAYLFEENESITELSCNVDDITGEEIAFAAEIMMKSGALDCFITPIIMKKGRPAYMLTVLCKNSDAEKFTKLIFKHTTSIGIRKYTPSRYTLERELKQDSGVTVKRSFGYGETKEKIEYEDIKAYALEKDISVFEARKKLKS